MAEIDVPDLAVGTVEKAVFPARTVINQLIRQRKGSRRHISRYTTDGVDGYDPAGASLLQRPDVGAIVHRVRRNPMTRAVARQKRDLDILPAAQQHVRGGFTIGRLTRDLVAQVKFLAERIKATTTDNSEHQTTFSGKA